MSSNIQISVSGKFFSEGGEKWRARGFSYGPFPPRTDGQYLPESKRLREDLEHIRGLNGNCIRVYHPPTRELLDEAYERGIRVFADVPWEKHRCFFEDWDSQSAALAQASELASTFGDHPGLFAISVGNEIPVDIVRFYGRQRISRFVTEMIDAVKQASPDCLTTYVSFPTTEFLTVERCDFATFNVYLHDERLLGAYIDRLQHIAGTRPLLLGEYGTDSMRDGEREQARCLSSLVRRAHQHGLAGAFIFSYTDEWFTGGQLIGDWKFGVTRCDRSDKSAAEVLKKEWAALPTSSAELPGVSVVVCSYNGGATLAECLQSLMELDYDDYEIILVDDGSTDSTRAIAEMFPQVVYHYQANQGLSVARNVGSELATREIVAYTDSDCVADRDWLTHLMTAMDCQGVDAIGGPNIAPPSDGWVAKCVAASPGNPSHVMLDDQLAEHVPGCNMAFRRETLLTLGGFDPQFRQAGDDVDICWRLLDAGMKIGYASGAMVWHKRRATVRAYCKQQSGYGRSEALVIFKHPQRCDLLGQAIWQGIIYGDGAVGLPLSSNIIYHGQFGSGLFQLIYRHNRYAPWSVLMSSAWHVLALFVLLLGTLFPWLAIVAVTMVLATVAICMRSAVAAPLPKGAPWWCRPLIAYLHWVQPILRGWHRTTHLIRNKRIPQDTLSVSEEFLSGNRIDRKRISSSTYDFHWDNRHNLGRLELLAALVELAKRRGWKGNFDNAWADWDVKLFGDFWHEITVRTATEELGWPRRFTRARCTARPTRGSTLVGTMIGVWLVASGLSGQIWAITAGVFAALAYWVVAARSRKRSVYSVSRLVADAAKEAGLAPPAEVQQHACEFQAKAFSCTRHHRFCDEEELPQGGVKAAVP